MGEKNIFDSPGNNFDMMGESIYSTSTAKKRFMDKNRERFQTLSPKEDGNELLYC
jgi:hypothetical protein